MLVTIDIGNTNLHLGVFQEGVGASASGGLVPLIFHKIMRAEEVNLEELAIEPYMPLISEILIASVNPVVEDSLTSWLEKNYPKKPLKFPEDIKVPVTVLVKEPEKVGIDRLLNAVAAYKRTKGSIIVVDMGTAITVDAVSERGEFLGGIIAPGLEVLKKALHLRTAFLPEVTPKKPDYCVGKDTEQAITSGLYWGIVGIVERLIKGVKRELGGDPRVIATGGDAKLFADDIGLFQEVIPHLTLEGMAVTYLASESLSP
ncbi:MAG TPA: type III pantothenate kinase [Candidatus Hypogeohydataceae bacterium YC41]